MKIKTQLIKVCGMNAAEVVPIGKLIALTAYIRKKKDLKSIILARTIESEDISIDPIDTERIIKESYEQLYAIKLDKLD